MFRAFSLAIHQITDPAILKVLAKSFALTLVIFAGLGFALSLVAERIALAGGWGEDGGTVAGVLAAIGTVLVAWMLFRAVAIPIIGFFADEVVAAVERRHYAAATTQAQAPSFGLSVQLALMSVARLILVNLLALPIYAVLLFTAIGPLVLFIAVNALLLGRDLGEMVSARHMNGGARKSWLRASRGQRLLLGFIVTGLFMIPLINIFAPIIGAAMATHLFHDRRGADFVGV